MGTVGPQYILDLSFKALRPPLPKLQRPQTLSGKCINREVSETSLLIFCKSPYIIYIVELRTLVELNEDLIIFNKISYIVELPKSGGLRFRISG